jgi:bile acid:Na+ symporter, BASS family
MDAFLQVVQKSALLVFLVSSMAATGLGITPRAVVAPLRDMRFVTTAILLNFVAAPALSWLLSRALRLNPAHAAGLMLLGCAAGAPFLPKLVVVARGDLALSATLVILLTVGTIIFMPLALPFLIPTLHADAWEIAKPLLILIVAPLVIGMIIRILAAPFSAQASRFLANLGNLALLVLFVLLIVLNLGPLSGVVGSGAILAGILHFIGLFALTWLGSKGQTSQTVLALGTAARNFGAALVPAAGTSASRDTTVMLLVSAIVGLVLAFISAIWVKRQSAGRTKVP